MTARAKKLWIVLIALCSLPGCAGREVPEAAPLVVRSAGCPVPTAPELPPLDAALPLDAPENVRRLLTRDDLCRHYITGLRAALRCYESQTGGQ